MAAYLQARLAFSMALFNLGSMAWVDVDEDGFVRLSIAEFSL
ncbi:MAG: hypothetical protein U1F68_20025 [Gammaproteobacteria bacterium]